jgi:integrase
MPKLTQRSIEALEAKETRYEVPDTDATGLYVRVERTGSKAFYLRYRLNGKPQVQRLGRVGELPLTRAREMTRAIRAQATEHEAGRADSPKPDRKPKTEPHTIGSWIDGPYAARVLRHRKSGEATHKRLQAAFSGKVWAMPLDSPKLAQAALEWRQDRLDAGRMPSTVNRDTTALKAAIAYAVEMEVIEAHPLQRMRPLKETQEQRVRYLTDAEEQSLFAALEARAERLRAERDSGNSWRRERGLTERLDLRTVRYVDFIEPAIVLMLNTGLRRGECFHLQWTDIDEHARILTVRASGTKSGKARRIPLNDTVLDMLEAWRPMAGGSELVFPSPRGGGVIHDFKNSWARLMADAGIEAFRVHDLRHTFASRLVQRGHPLYTVSQLLGHSSISMTERYAHLAPENGLAAVQSLNAPKGSIVDFPGKVKK